MKFKLFDLTFGGELAGLLGMVAFVWLAGIELTAGVVVGLGCAALLSTALRFFIWQKRNERKLL